MLRSRPRRSCPSLTRAEFDVAVERMAAGGIETIADRDQAWRDFAGWRVNYDTVLLALAEQTHAPYAPWSSSTPDRARSKLATVWPGLRSRRISRNPSRS